MAAATALWLQATAAAPCAPWLVPAGSPQQQQQQQQLGPPVLGLASVQQHWSSSSEEVLIATCNRLCSAGRVSDAVDALQSVVAARHQRAGGVVTNNNNHLFYRLIKACQAHKDLALGRRVHALAAASGLDGDSFLATHLIAMYGAHWAVDAAVQAFDAVARPSAQNWAAVIFACARHGQAARGVALYARMRRDRASAAAAGGGGGAEPDARVFVAALKACAVARDLDAGTRVHADVASTAAAAAEDVYVRNGLIDMYAKCGRVEDARRVFDATKRKDVVTWNAMVAGYAQRGRGREALDLADRMDVPPNAVTFVSVLQACAAVGAGALERGRRVHAQARRAGVHQDVAVGGSLVNMYAKCGGGGGGGGGDGGEGLDEARRVFDGLPVKNVVTWNVMLAGYAQRGRGEDALRLYDQWQVQQRQCGDGGGGESSLVARPNAVTLVCVLQACAGVGAPALQRGRRLHAVVATTGGVEGGDDEAVVLGGSLVNMYAKCGSLEDARRVFDAIPEGKRNVVTWNAMLAGYAQHGRGRDALALYFGGGGGDHGHDRGQQERQQEANGVTFVCLLQACASVGADALAQGKLLHAHIRRRAARGGALEHEEEVEVVVVGGSLVHMYAKCGDLDEARRVFDAIPQGKRNVVTWTAMIAAYAQAGGVRNCEEALRLYGRMVANEEGGVAPPDAVTMACLLHACAGVGPPALRHGQKLHAHVEAAGWTDHAALASALVGMYAKCGTAGAARRAFDGLPPRSRRSVAAWTAVVAAYVEHGAPGEALQLYHHAQEEWEPPDAAAFGWLLQACAAVGGGAAREGRDLHARIVREQGPVVVAAVGGSLVSMYARCGGARAARAVFDELPCRNVVAWNAMIAGYAQQGMAADALALYADMVQQQEAGAPNSVTFVCLLQACAAAGALPMGRRLHAHIQRLGLLQPPPDQDQEQAGVLGGALVNLYAKCGAMREAQAAFDATPAARRTALTVGALMSGYTRAGDARAVLALLRQLDQPPDGPAVLAALTACSHAGLVDEGRAVFAAVAAPSAAHYAAMTDLLARAGHLRDALHMARQATEASAAGAGAGSTTTTPTSPAAVWVTVLGACRKWGGQADADAGVEVAQAAFAAAVRADARDPAAYVLMAHVYARAGMWDAARAVDRRRVGAGAWKRPGECWWAGDDDGSGGGGGGCGGEVVHRFRAGRVVGAVGWGSGSDDDDEDDEAEVADGGGAGGGGVARGWGLVAGGSTTAVVE